MARVLGRVRLSESTEESTSVERQVEIIENWAHSNGHEVVGWATDVDVSRSVDPLEAPDLKPWLNQQDRIAQWDIIACWKLDRLATGSIYLNKVMEWCKNHDKAIVSVTENFDLSTWIGRMVANVIAGVAEGEWEAIRERATSSRDKLRRLGRWAGGAPVYGFKAVQRKGGGYYIEHDPEAKPHLRWMVERVIAGDSLNSIAKTFNEQGVPTPQDLRRQQTGKEPRAKPAVWRTSTLKSILTSQTLRGNMSHQGKAVRGPDGMPIAAGEPLVTLAEWEQLQARLVHGVVPKTRTRTTSMLLDIAYCKLCGSKLHRQGAHKKGKDYHYYFCASENGERVNPCGARRIRSDLLHGAVSELMMDEIGDIEETYKTFVPAQDYTGELEEVKASLKEVAAMYSSARSETTRGVLEVQMNALDERIAELEKSPQTEERWERKGTGRTYREIWESTETESGKRQILLDAGIWVEAKEGPFEYHIYVPEDIRERLVKETS